MPSGPVQASSAADGNTRKALKALAAAMGASLEPRDRRYTLALSGGPPEEQRRASLRLAGLEVTSVAQEFNTGRPVRLDLRSDTVPLPVPVAVWRGLPGMSGGSVARSILIDQRASWRLATLGRYLDKHRADTEAAALAIRLIYESRAAGQAITTVESDREAAAKYGEWYRDAGGPNRALVQRWLLFIAKK